MTAKPVVAEKLPFAALILVKPVRSAVTLPEVSMVAVEGFVTFQVTAPEISCVELSENLRIADSFVGVLPPIRTLEFAGTMLSARTTGGPTFSDAVLAIEPEAAEIVTVPCFKVVARPVELTVATVASEVDHVTVLRGLEVPSE
jgi:hypothetical protein